MARKPAAKKPTKKKPTKKKTPDAPAPGVPALEAAPPRDNIDQLDSVELTLTAELGRTRQTVERVQEYGDQSLIELEKTVGDPVDIRLNGQLFARGEVVTVNENFGVKITEIIEPPA